MSRASGSLPSRQVTAPPHRQRSAPSIFPQGDLADVDRPGWIVDGQQRIAAVRAAYIESFPICVVASGRVDLRRAPLRFRSSDRLLVPLRLLRYAARVQRGEPVL